MSLVEEASPVFLPARAGSSNCSRVVVVVLCLVQLRPVPTSTKGFPHIISLGTSKEALSDTYMIKFHFDVFVIMPPCCCLHFGSLEYLITEY